MAAAGRRSGARRARAPPEGRGAQVRPGRRCVKTGAAILRLHARNARDGRPTPDPKVFMPFRTEIKPGTDARDPKRRTVDARPQGR
ncbi:3-keto-5-aminohexanoate cleavage protein [Xanthobacter dioxanivorans]|uniref:3-keto-5-aminohexanoate cleavage protein n=1 Tax=Xanthobacter dioxanivorans TaxID=2528964 RepID=A0A974PTJ4_9HYPH|nr:3-keto-5-aminohexanoate cleavage protein [Xanthobacter dioxanivorans]QRG09286.1 3-keto-5-aminohexanoate cleavage protein [Xanthobacter dioxanivorans]